MFNFLKLFFKNLVCRILNSLKGIKNLENESKQTPTKSILKKGDVPVKTGKKAAFSEVESEVIPEK